MPFTLDEEEEAELLELLDEDTTPELLDEDTTPELLDDEDTAPVLDEDELPLTPVLEDDDEVTFAW